MTDERLLERVFTRHLVDAIATASPPFARIASATSPSWSTERDSSATFAPSSASRSAIARPNPRPAPDTSAT